MGNTVDIDMVSVGTPGRIQNLRWSDKQTLSWDPRLTAAAYHLYGGLVSELSCSFSGNCLDGLDPDLTDTVFTDTDVPGVGEGNFYLVTAVDVAGNESPLGTSACGERVNAFPCP